MYVIQVKGDPAEKERDRAERLKQCREATLRETDIKPLREVRDGSILHQLLIPPHLCLLFLFGNA